MCHCCFGLVGVGLFLQRASERFALVLSAENSGRARFSSSSPRYSRANSGIRALAFRALAFRALAFRALAFSSAFRALADECVFARMLS